MKKTTKIVLKTASRVAGRAAKKYITRAAKDIVISMAGQSEGGPEAERTAVRVSDEMILRSMTEADRQQVVGMMRDFYSSEAVLTDGSDEIFNNDITECISESPYAEGFVFTNGDRDDAEDLLLGYAIIAHSFSTEYGRHCIWIEDLYLREEARGLGLASGFLDYLSAEYPDALHRLESECENAAAMELYKHKAFREMPYVEMFRE